MISSNRLVILGTVLLFLSSAIFCAGRKERRKIPEFEKVHTVFVVGNNPAADKAREMLREEKICFSLALKKDEADAILEINDSSTADRDLFRSRTSIVSGTLTLRTGELIWSDSARFSDAPFMNGSKTAVKIIFASLKSAADCKGRQKQSK